MIRALLILCLAYTPNAFAHWVLDNDESRLSFVTIKAANVGEVHRFRTLSGRIDEAGKLSLTINLASVDTLIPIRDERMQKLLFETNLFPEATFEAQLEPDQLDGLALASSRVFDVPGRLNIRDTSINLMLPVMATRFAHKGVVVSTLQPIIVNADAVGLAQGVEALREIAGLPSISLAVPVSFVLTFRG